MAMDDDTLSKILDQVNVIVDSVPGILARMQELEERLALLETEVHN
jgi:hypothetical protein